MARLFEMLFSPFRLRGTDIRNRILSTGHAAETALEQALEGLACPVRLVGDCLSPRSAEEAIYEGFIAGREV